MRAGASKRITNLDYLTDLSKGNTLFVDEMIEIFIAESPDEIIVLEKAIHEKDFKLIKSCAHKMISTIPFVGLDKIIETEVSEIEKLASAQAGSSAEFIQAPSEGLIKNIKKIEVLFSRIKEVYRLAILELKE